MTIQMEEFDGILRTGQQAIFTGTVLPERAKVEVSPSQRLVLQIPESDAVIDILLSVLLSQVSVAVEVKEGGIDLATLRNTVDYVLRIYLDGLGYALGHAYDLEITSAATDDGAHIVFGVDVPILVSQRTERPFTPGETIQLALDHPPLRRALADLRQAMRTPGDTGFYCYRAIEAIRRDFVENFKEARAAAWERLRTKLRVSRSWIDPLETRSLPQRHGEVTFMTDSERSDSFDRAWKVIDRYCQYLAQGKTPLPESSPVLGKATSGAVDPDS